MKKRISRLLLTSCIGIAIFTICHADTLMVPIPIDDDLNIIIPVNVGTALANLTLADAALNSCVQAAAAANGWKYTSYVTALTCSNDNISNLTGLEQFTNLKTLNLSGNKVVSLTPLDGLAKLNYLDVSGTGQMYLPTDVGNLSNLSSLNTLIVTNFSSTPLTSSVFSSGFSSLKNLTINTAGDLDAGLSATLETRAGTGLQVTVSTAAVTGATAVGNTPGSFMVDDSGSATYNIPIAVPPGAAGMQPNLSLGYNSQSGNGLVGMGFALHGLSVITRCPQTVATDGNAGGVSLTASDRYCLDGQRLIATNTGLAYNAAGQVYRTERDAFTQITASGVAGTAPQSFITKTKSGQTIEYGVTTDARVMEGTNVLVWAADKITDTVNNYISIRYCNYGYTNYCASSYTGTPGTGEYFPARIDYAANDTQGAAASSSVLFLYATRTDTFKGYIGGYTVNNTVRLTNIQVTEAGTSIRDYRLSYDYGPNTSSSRLKTVTECDSNNLSSANCLAATNLAYSDGSSGYNAYNYVGMTITDQNTVNLSRALDLDGDGKTDLLVPDSTGWYFGITNGSTYTWTNTNVPIGNDSYAKPLDYNSDGKADLIVPGSLGGTYTAANWYVLQSTGTTFQVINTGIPNTGYNLNPQLIDINGDGHPDLVYVNGSYWNIRLNTGSGFSTTATITPAPNNNYTYAKPIDYDGDGKMDLLVPGPLTGYPNANWYVFKSTGTSFTVVDTGIANTNYTQAQLIDVNGDGRPDLLYPNGTYWYVSYNTGGGFSTPVATTIPTTNSSWVKFFDLNGDGRLDMGVPLNNNTVDIYVNKPTGFTRATSTLNPVGWGSNLTGFDNPKVGDVNGDGHLDVVYFFPYWNGLYYTYPIYLATHIDGLPDKLTTITNGLGAQTVVTYKPLTNYAGQVYTKGTGSVFPQQDYQGAVYVVSQFTTSDGLGGTYPVTYSYTGARMDVQGRGFVGFSQITAMDTVTGISTQINYSQAFPTTGMVSSSTKKLNGVVIGSTVNTFPQFTIAPNTIYFPYVQTETDQIFDLPNGGVQGPLVKTTVATNYYTGTPPTACSGALPDNYGNPTCISVQNTANGQTFTKTTINTYSNDTTNWILGRLTNAKVTNTLPDNTHQTRESSFTYYPTTGLLWTEVVEPNGNGSGVINMMQTTTYTYDNFGNKTGATVSGADGVSRPVTASDTASTASAPYTYGAGRFETGFNAASQGETRVYDARFGTVYTLTGPNGLSTDWRYDTFGRKKTETRADGTTTTWTYNSCGACVIYAKYYVVQTTSGAPTVTVYYDKLDREVRTQTVGYNGALIVKDTVYDSKGRIYQVSRPYYSGDTPYWTTYGYDALSRVNSVTLPTPSGTTATTLTTTAYPGLSATVTAYRDGLALATTQTKDAIGELVSVKDANTNTTTYQYDPFGNLTQVKDPVGNLTKMTYDLRGRKLTMIDPDMGSWQYKYDSVGDLTWQQDAKGQQIWMYYQDPLGRMTKRTESEGDTTWTYDSATLSGPAAKGKLSQVAWPGGSRTYVYDNKGRPSTETTTLSGVNYTITTTYDSNSRRDTLSYPDGFSVRNNYNTNGYLSSVTNTSTGANYWSAPAYNAAGQTTAFNLGNTATTGNVILTTVRQYDSATGLIKGISTGVGTGSATQYLTYQYDTLGNLKQRVDGNQANLTENFVGYDNLNRLTSAAVVGGASKSMTYDALGDILTKSDVGTYTYDPAHKHAVLTAGTGSYTNDANGSQITGPNGRVIQYTSFNQPLSITQGGKVNSFVYGGDHLRVSETTTDGTTIILQPRMDQGAHYEELHKTDGTVEQKNFIYAGKEFVAVYTARPSGTPDTRYYHKDHLGSVDTITDESGNVVNRLSYDAWGKRRNGNWTDATAPISSITHHGFTGHEMLDDMGLVNMNGRVYDPTLGRFLSADPTMQDPGNPQILNRYSYTGNNPLTYTDPSGYSFWKSLFNIVKIVVAAVVAFYSGGFVYFYLGSGAFGAAFGAVASGIIGGAVGGFVGGFIASGGSVQAGLAGAATGAIFGGIGAFADGMQAGGSAGWGDGQINRVLAHAAGGGISSTLQGQKFGPGALSAGFSEAVSPGISKNFNASGQVGVIERTVASAVVGGTASVLGGGKFENGAKTAAFARLFNEEMTESQKQAAADAVARANAQGAAMQAAFGADYNTNPPITGTQASLGLGVLALFTGVAGAVYDVIELTYVSIGATVSALAVSPTQGNMADVILSIGTRGMAPWVGHGITEAIDAYGNIIRAGNLAHEIDNEKP